MLLSGTAVAHHPETIGDALAFGSRLNGTPETSNRSGESPRALSAKRRAGNVEPVRRIAPGAFG